MKNRKALIIMLVLGAVLLAAAAVVYFVFVRGPQTSQPDIKLPPTLEELADEYPDLAPVLSDPELGSVYKEFLVAYEENGEDAALELARQRGLLVAKDGEEYVRGTLVLDTNDHASLIVQLEEVGVSVTSAYQDRVDVAVPLDIVMDQLESDDPGAIFNQLTELEHVIAVRLPTPRVPDGSSIEGEGVGVIAANVWQDAGITGAGIRVAVLDLGFGGYESLLGVELPDNVTYAEFGWFDEDDDVHGTACAEIVHEVAPGAELVLAKYDGGDAALGEAVEWLVSQNVDIISHSAGGMVGPRDGSEWDALLVDQLAARGILWVNAAGNEGLSHYRGVFADADGDGIHELAPGEEVLPVYSYGDSVIVALSWDDDWEQPTQDYELFVYDSSGTKIASSEEPQTGEVGQAPVEWIRCYTGGETVYAVIQAYDVDRAATLDVFLMGADAGYRTSDHSISPPADAVHSLTVGAANWQDDSLADYSSQGPTSDGRLKPEISAPTGVSGASYGEAEFTGTSSSCPHVAGAAALVWQAHPEFTRQQTVDFLLAHAVDLGPAGPDTGFGYGRLQLPDSPDAVPFPVSTPTEPAADAPTPAPGATSVPLPTPTQVPYVTPTPGPTPVPPPPPGGGGTGALGLLAGVSLLVMALGCGGVGLLVVAGVGLILVARRARRSRRPAPPVAPAFQQTVPPPAAPAQPQAVRCPHCGAAIRPGARFCASCGNTLVAADQPHVCRHCGAPLKEGARFCAKCGKPVD